MTKIIIKVSDFLKFSEIELREVPSVNTALNRLKDHHAERCSKLSEAIQQTKTHNQNNVDTITRLRATLHSLTAPK